MMAWKLQLWDLGLVEGWNVSPRVKHINCFYTGRYWYRIGGDEVIYLSTRLGIYNASAICCCARDCKEIPHSSPQMTSV